MNCYSDLATLKSASYLNLSVTTHDTYLTRLLDTASRQVDNYCRRFFYCWEGTRYYDGARRILFTDDILSITTFKLDTDADGTYETTLTANTDYVLYPINEYPKTLAEISSLGTRQQTNFAPDIKRGVQIIGVFGFGDETSRGASPYLASGAVVNTGNMTDSATTHALATGTGALFSAGMTIRIGSEQFYVSGVSTDTLTVERGVNGTTAAAHLAGVAIYIYQYPYAVYQSTLIMAMRAWKRKDSAYQDVVGYGELGTVISSKGFDPDAAKLLLPYRKPNSG